jgi:hypothetical protein
MPSRVRSALALIVIVACQVGLVFGAIWLCGLRTERDDDERPLRSCYAVLSSWRHSNGWVPPPRRWSDYFYSGYPIPWVESREDRYGRPESEDEAELLGTVVLGRNQVVPLCLLLLALMIPPLFAVEVRHGWARLRRRPRLRRSRRRCVTWVVVCMATGGLAVTLLDTLTDPDSSIRYGVAHAVMGRPPAQRLRVPDPQSTPANPIFRDPPQVESVRVWRARFRPESWSPQDRFQPHALAEDWWWRSWRASVGLVVGGLVGCAVFRPWRRSYPADKLGAAGTSCPAC